MERGFSVPGVPAVPIIGIFANLALIINLPVDGVVTGVLLVTVLVIAYLVWGGAPEVGELFREAVPAGQTEPTPRSGPAITTEETQMQGDASETTDEPEESQFRVLVPIARPDRAPRYVRLAAALARGREEDPFVQVVNVTELPDQTPHEMVAEAAQGRAERIAEYLAAEDLDVKYTVEGHTSRDIPFDILQTARDDEAALILMGYPEERPELTQAVEYKSPCDVVFASGFGTPWVPPIKQVTVGAGGGPHHQGSLTMVRALVAQGADVHIVSVTSTREGTAEDPTETAAVFEEFDVDIAEVEASTVAEGLVEAAAVDGGVLVIGASRDRRLSQWVFGSTPDRVVERAKAADVPVLVYTTPGGITGRIEDYLFPVYRYLRARVRRGDTVPASIPAAEQDN